MTRGERAVAFILGVITCSLLSCGLSLIARENDLILSGAHSIAAHMSEELAPLQNQTSSRTATTRGSNLYPYNGAHHDAGQRDDTKDALEGTISENILQVDGSNRSSQLWQSLQERLGFRTRGYQPNGGFGEVLRSLFARLNIAFPNTRNVSKSGLVGSDVDGAKAHSSGQNHDAPNLESRSVVRPYQDLHSSRFQADGLSLMKKRLGAGNWISAVLGGIMGIVACALIATGALMLITIRRDHEGPVRRTIFNTLEDNGSGDTGDSVDEIVPEEAV